MPPSIFATSHRAGSRRSRHLHIRTWAQQRVRRPLAERRAFAPGGRCAELLATRPIAARVGDTLFVHGGILAKHVAYGLDRISDEVDAWLRGKRANPPAIAIAEEPPSGRALIPPREQTPIAPSYRRYCSRSTPNEWSSATRSSTRGSTACPLGSSGVSTLAFLTISGTDRGARN